MNRVGDAGTEKTIMNALCITANDTALGRMSVPVSPLEAVMQAITAAGSEILRTR